MILKNKEVYTVHSNMNRFSAADEIAELAIFVCSDRIKFITGTFLFIDGGQRGSVV